MRIIRLVRGFLLLLVLLLAGCRWPLPASPTPVLPPTPAGEGPAATPCPPAMAKQPTSHPADPFDLISRDSMVTFLEGLTAIQPYSGWRNSGTTGEAEALDYTAAQLSQFEHLRHLGLELERQEFHTFLTIEIWQSQLYLLVNDREIEVPADSPRGHRDDIRQALRFDSDGQLNDEERDPVEAGGPVFLVDSYRDVVDLAAGDLDGKVAFVDYAVVDRILVDPDQVAMSLSKLLAAGPAGLVLVTRFSNQVGQSHGTFVGDGSSFYALQEAYAPPTLYVRLEDLGPAGIQAWDDLTKIEAARLVVDADVFCPGRSGNLVARIPGLDSSRAVILGAHIDSPNGPGALDDGSGSAVLMEVARVLDAAQFQPPVDVYLSWFGSEELGLYGSYHFAATHQELLDRTIAMLQIDMLSCPLDGIQPRLDLVTWPYGRLGERRLAWPEYLSEETSKRGIATYPVGYYGIESDNSAFAGFGVPNANLIYKNDREMEQAGSIHYASHIHDPYDTLDLVRKMGDVLEQMAGVALVAALETGQSAPDLRPAPAPDHRAVFVASQTEPIHMAPTTFTDMGMAFEMLGFDVDMLAYGQPFGVADLADADLVVALPVVDYPSPEGDVSVYDAAWSEGELAALESYVDEGGLLVLTNSRYRLKYGNALQDPNEDWADMNALAGRFGVSYRQGCLPDAAISADGDTPLLQGISRLDLAGANVPLGNGVPFSLEHGGQVLAAVQGEPLMALLDHGDAHGQVLILADVGILGAGWGEPTNLRYWQNLARYAAGRE
jgi:hypothetical protein